MMFLVLEFFKLTFEKGTLLSDTHAIHRIQV